MKIIGAGLAGLIAGNLFPMAEIIEAGSEAQIGHKAVLRFRSKAVGDAVGIDFRKVVVHKGIWSKGEFRKPTIQLANLYSRKVINRIADRSIWNLDPAERFIAPDDFIEQLALRCKGRIEWNRKVENLAQIKGEPLISTMPMSVMQLLLNEVQLSTSPEFNFEPIQVKRWTVDNCDTFQTVYFPDESTNLYRASITGNLLIAEFMVQDDDPLNNEREISNAFGIDFADTAEKDRINQRFGKIAPIDDSWRREFIFNLSQKHNIFSLGRFATWRNILLDDVLKDIYVIKRLIGADGYTAKMHAAK